MNQNINLAELLRQVREIPKGEIETLRTLRAIINGKLGKRTITKEQQDAMQAARRGKKG